MDLEFDTPEGRWRSEQILLHQMLNLTLQNYWFLLDNPDYPKLYDTDMIYLLPEQLERKPTRRQLKEMQNFLRTTMRMTDDEIEHHIDLAKGVEIFRTIPRMMDHGGGDCDNWAAARAAEICAAATRLGGTSRAKPYLVWRESGGHMIYHAKVMHGDGTDEDPSIIKGMGGQDRAPDRLEECRKNYERYDNMWQRAKGILAVERFSSEGARVARAQELKDACDSFGFLPKDGVFRVGPAQPAVVGYRHYEAPRQLAAARGLDVLGAAKRSLIGRGGHGGGHHGGGHHGGFGGIRQNWGFNGPPAYIIEPDYDDLDDVDVAVYNFNIETAAPAPQGRRW